VFGVGEHHRLDFAVFVARNRPCHDCSGYQTHSAHKCFFDG
jgi:hypothetical protein